MRTFALLALLYGCGSSPSGPTHDQIVNACTHLCQCETATSDSSCHDSCAAAPGSGGPTSLSNGSFSFSSFSSSLSANPFGMLDQACVDCFTTASCADITAGGACSAECQ